MSLQDIMKQLQAINRASATGHPKIAIAELCGVIQALVLEIEKIQSPKLTILTQADQPVIPKIPETKQPAQPLVPIKRDDRPLRTPPLKRPSRIRPLNAGDAE